MQNFKNQSTNPTETMSLADGVDDTDTTNLTPFMDFMCYDSLGKSARLDYFILSVISNMDSGSLIKFSDVFGEPFVELFEPEELDRLKLDLMLFAQRYPDDLMLLLVDECHEPVFLTK